MFIIKPTDTNEIFAYLNDPRNTPSLRAELAEIPHPFCRASVAIRRSGQKYSACAYAHESSKRSIDLPVERLSCLFKLKQTSYSLAHVLDNRGKPALDVEVRHGRLKISFGEPDDSCLASEKEFGSVCELTQQLEAFACVSNVAINAVYEQFGLASPNITLEVGPSLVRR